MASAFSHIAIPALFYAVFESPTMNVKLLMLAMICSILPDIDVIAFYLGIPYASPWGHRGFTHSIVFAAFLGLILTPFYRYLNSTPRLVFYFCFGCCVSHGMLDALTNGGLGIAFFWPFSDERYFFPFRPVQVSPIGINSFFSEWGIRVLVSESVWILLPTLSVGLISALVRRKFFEKNDDKTQHS